MAAISCGEGGKSGQLSRPLGWRQTRPVLHVATGAAGSMDERRYAKVIGRLQSRIARRRVRSRLSTGYGCLASESVDKSRLLFGAELLLRSSLRNRHHERRFTR